MEMSRLPSAEYWAENHENRVFHQNADDAFIIIIMQDST